MTGVFGRGFNDHLHNLKDGKIQTEKSRVENIKEVSEWHTEGALGDAAATIMQGMPNTIIKWMGYALDAADLLTVQSRAVTTGQIRTTDSYTHNTLYDATNPNPNHWVEVPGFRSAIQQRQSKHLQAKTSILLQ